jgi:hypothetical protein
MSVHHWPIGGRLETFTSGGKGLPDEDCRRMLRAIARWSEGLHAGEWIESLSIHMCPIVDDDKVTWSAVVVVGSFQ